LKSISILWAHKSCFIFEGLQLSWSNAIRSQDDFLWPFMFYGLIVGQQKGASWINSASQPSVELVSQVSCRHLINLWWTYTHSRAGNLRFHSIPHHSIPFQFVPALSRKIKCFREYFKTSYMWFKSIIIFLQHTILFRYDL